VAKKNQYIDNAEFHRQIVEYQRAVREAKKHKQKKPRINDYLGKCLLLIAQNVIRMTKDGVQIFAKYPMKEEMIGDAVENMVQYFGNYKPKYKNPFAYFTQITYWAFVRRIQKEKKVLYARYKMHEQLSVLTQLDGVNEDAIHSQFQIYDNISDFIEKYEDAQRKKMAKRKRALTLKSKQSKIGGRK